MKLALSLEGTASIVALGWIKWERVTELATEEFQLLQGTKSRLLGGFLKFFNQNFSAELLCLPLTHLRGDLSNVLNVFAY